MHIFPKCGVRVFAMALAYCVSAAPVLAQDLTLDKAFETAFATSPHAAAARARTAAAIAERKQSGALPNPELSIEAENIYGSGPYNGFDNAETTYGISQLIELPAKRGSRLRMSDAEKEKAGHAQQSSLLDLRRDVHIAFAEVAAAQQELSLRQEQQKLAAEVRHSVVAKVEAGKEPPIQKNKAEIEFSSSNIALERAARHLKAKQRILSLLAGISNTEITVDAASLPAVSAPADIGVYRERLQASPDAKSTDSDIARAEANFNYEKANALPDPTFNFGVKDIHGEDNQAFIAGVSFPIPVFSRNQSGIDRAREVLTATRLDQVGWHNEREATLNNIYADFSTAYSEAQALQSTIVPGAEEAFSFAREGYNAGKFGYLDVLDAQRTLFDTREQLNTAILEYHRQRAHIERLTAAPLSQTRKD